MSDLLTKTCLNQLKQKVIQFKIVKINIESDLKEIMTDSDLVYSTESGRTCPTCERAIDACNCVEVDPTGDGIVRVGRETKGRKGKGVTTISGLLMKEKELKAFAKKLKQKCSTGGAIKNGVIEIQGDHRDLLVELIKKEGFQVKKAGG